MIIATRLSAVWQVAGVAAAALCCYLVSQSVATERASLDKVDRQIAETRNDIGKLQMEIGVRARMGQLESWNREVLALQAPRPAQFVASGLQLASLYGRKDQPSLQLDPAIAAQQGSPTNVAYRPTPVPPAPASATVASEPEVASVQPVLRAASFVRPAPDRLSSQPAMGSTTAPVMQKVSFEVAKPAQPNRTEKALEPAKASHAGRGSALLPDDIGLLAAREARGARDNDKAVR